MHGTDGPPYHVLLTCCGLHNKLWDIDGLDKRWQEGVQSIWSTAHDNYDDNNDDMLDGTAVNEVGVPSAPDPILHLRTQHPSNSMEWVMRDWSLITTDCNRLQHRGQ